MITTWNTKVRALEGAELADHWPPGEEQREQARVQKSMVGEAPTGEAIPVFPLLFFSHGMAGSRTAYSMICSEFASHGFVVCALEHRDGSVPATVVNHPLTKDVQRHPHFKDFGHYHVVDFIFPEKDKHDTNPTHHVDDALRTAQIEMRLDEIEEAYQIMRLIAAGKGAEVASRDCRKIGTLCGRQGSPKKIDWASWKDRVDVENVTLAGHSFGSATVVEALRQKNRFSHTKQAIIYDLWGMPLHKIDQLKEHPLTIPLLCVASEAFMYWPANFDIMQSVCEEVARGDKACWLVTIRGSSHISTSDFGILYPFLSTYLLKTTMGATRIIDLSIDVAFEFLAQVMHSREMPFKRYLGPKRLLDLALVQDIPSEHQPAARWTAIRLKFDHEASQRILGGRKAYWKKAKMEGQEEIWVHQKPSKPESAS